MKDTSKLTNKASWMYGYVLGGLDNFISPTEVGNAYGKAVLGSEGYHSSIASPTLLKLTQMGLLERNEKGHYRAIREND